MMIVPIGSVHNSVAAPDDDIWGGLTSRIDLDREKFAPESLNGLTEFSHVEVIFLLHLIDDSEVVTGARYPRGRTDFPKVGIFAQRGRNRPNRIGATVCRLVKADGLSVYVEGLDAIDGTPVLDLKPYLREFGPRGEVRQPDWATELMRTYWNSRD